MAKKATKAKAADPKRCPRCAGRLMVHWGKAECTVPGCGWSGKLGE
jgi:hypothetical protein